MNTSHNHNSDAQQGQPEPGHPHAGAAQSALVRSPKRDGLAIRGLKEAVRLSVGAAFLPVRVLRPIVMSRPMQPARDAADAALRRVIDALASIIAEQLRYNYEVQELIDAHTERLLGNLTGAPLVAELVRVQAQQIIDFLAQSPKLAGRLVEAVAGQYIGTLQNNPTLLRPLVRTVADDYITWLAVQPDAVDALVNTAASNYVAHLTERPQELEPLVRAVAGRYVGYLGERPGVLQELVENVAGGYLRHLEQHPELLDSVVSKVGGRFMEEIRRDPAALNSLVQVVGDRYMDHLQQNPDNVQELLTGQSVTMATEIIEEVRSRSSGADSAIEKMVRNLLGMKPRSEPAAPAQGEAGS